MSDPEKPIVDALASFSDTLVSDFDVSELFYRLVDACIELADADEAGLLLVDRDGELGIAAATSQSAHLVELLQLQAREGPCLDAFRTGEPVRTGPLDEAAAEERWPEFARLATSAGFDSVLAVPMRLREKTLGSLNLFRSGPGEAAERDMIAAQILADLAAVAISQNRVALDAREMVDQLQTALDSRVVIEQAKGIVAAQTKLDVATAFERIRSYARSGNQRLHEVAEEIASGRFDVDVFVDGSHGA